MRKSLPAPFPLIPTSLIILHLCRDCVPILGVSSFTAHGAGP